MLRFSANISTLFTEVELLDRPSAAAESGFKAIEIQFPYAVDPTLFSSACSSADVEVVLMNLPPPDLRRSELGRACRPGEEAAFRDDLARAMDYALAAKCLRLNCLVGNIPAGESVESCWPVLVSNLQYAAEATASAGIQLLVEVMNPVDLPRFLLCSSEIGDKLLSAVGHCNLALQYDIYHRRAAGENWLVQLQRRLPVVGHIQFSDYPGRHEPGSGELDMDALFRFLRGADYSGWLGCEFFPSTNTRESLAWWRQLSLD